MWGTSFYSGCVGVWRNPGAILAENLSKGRGRDGGGGEVYTEQSQPRQGVQCFEASSGIHVPDAQSAIIRSTDALPPIGRHGNCVDPVSMSFQCV